MIESNTLITTCLSCNSLLYNDIANGYETFLPCNHTLCNNCEKESLSVQCCKSCDSDILFHFPNNYLKQYLILNNQQKQAQTQSPQIRKPSYVPQSQQKAGGGFNGMQQPITANISIYSEKRHSHSSETATNSFVIPSKSTSPTLPITPTTGAYTLDEDEDDEHDSILIEQNDLCNQHNQEFHSYCNDCKRIVCPGCMQDDHIDHKEIQIDRTTINRFMLDKNEFKIISAQPIVHNPYLTPAQQQQQQNSTLDQQLFELVKQHKLSKLFKQQSTTHYSNEFKRVQDEFTLYSQLIEERRCYLLKFMENQYKSEQIQLDNQIKTLESQAEIIKKCLVDIKSGEKNKLKIIRNLSKINTKLTKMVINSNNVNNYQYQPHDINNSLSDTLRSLGKIKYSFKNSKQLLALSKERTFQFDIDSNHFLPYSEIHQDSNPMKDTVLSFKVVTIKDTTNGNKESSVLLTVSENSKSNQIEISRLFLKQNQIQSKTIIPLKSFKTNSSIAITKDSSTLFIIGGIHQKSGDYLKEIDRYNLSTNKYDAAISSLSKPKYNCLTCCTDDQRYIYIFGGNYKSLQLGRASIEIERFDTQTNKCEIISKFQDPDLLDFNKTPLLYCFYFNNFIYYLSNKKFKRYNCTKNSIESLEFPNHSENYNNSISCNFDTETSHLLLIINDSIFYYPLTQLSPKDVSPNKWYPKYVKINSTDFSSSTSCANIIGSRLSSSTSINNLNTSSFLVENLHGLLIYNETN